ncbi:MAG: GyrI-like domain-containing protein [Anaerolineae bacterium]|nr:GyrI-like domain-containing protein [Anaerolineae bacterium]
MEPTIVEKGQIILLGFSFYGDPFTSPGWTEGNEISRLWHRFEDFLNRNRDRLKNVKHAGVGYEVWGMTGESETQGQFDIFAGIELANLEDVPVEALIKILPPTAYAVFTLKGSLINSDWSRLIYQEWLPNSGYEEAYRFNFQRYDQRFKGVDKLTESELDVYVPIRPAGSNGQAAQA